MTTVMSNHPMNRPAGSAFGSTARASIIAALPAVGYIERYAKTVKAPMKMTIYVALLLTLTCLCVLVVAESPQKEKVPPVTFEEAVTIAKQYLQEHNLSVSNMYIESAALVTDPVKLEGDVFGEGHGDRIARPKGLTKKSPLWRIKWVPADRYHRHQPQVQTNIVSRVDSNGEQFVPIGTGGVTIGGELWLFIFMNREIVVASGY